MFRHALVALALVAGCGEKTDPVSTKHPIVCPDPTSPFCPAQKVFATTCARSGCHVPGGEAPMSLKLLDSYDNLVSVPTISLCPGGVRVVPGDPDASCVWQLLLDDTMPYEGGPLDPAGKQTIHDWIQAGAQR